MSENQKINILYIAGAGRSGSTIIGNILGEFGTNFTIGEFTSIWQSDIDFQNCGCGELTSKCSTWQDILNHAFGQPTFKNLPLPKGINFVSGLVSYISILLQRSFYSEQYIQFLETCYSTINHRTGASFIIDETKLIGHLLALKESSQFNLYILHLVRDPRAVVHSWQRVKKRPGNNQGALPRYNLIKALRHWITQHLLIPLQFRNAERYLQIRYEDFAQSPRTEIEKIIKWAGFEGQSPFKNDHQVIINKKHHLLGSNPVGAIQGVININLDNSWETEMPPLKKIWVTFLTWPLLLYYRYSIFK